MGPTDYATFALTQVCPRHQCQGPRGYGGDGPERTQGLAGDAGKLRQTDGELKGGSRKTRNPEGSWE